MKQHKMLHMPRTITIIVRSICCSRIKGPVDDFDKSDKDEGEGDDRFKDASDQL